MASCTAARIHRQSSCASIRQRVRWTTWVGDGDTGPRVSDLRTNATTQIPIDYAGLPATIFRLGRGPDGMLYGGTMMPTKLFKIDPRSGGLADVGTVGQGEVYSFLSF